MIQPFLGAVASSNWTKPWPSAAPSRFADRNAYVVEEQFRGVLPFHPDLVQDPAHAGNRACRLRPPAMRKPHGAPWSVAVFDGPRFTHCRPWPPLVMNVLGTVSHDVVVAHRGQGLGGDALEVPIRLPGLGSSPIRAWTHSPLASLGSQEPFLFLRTVIQHIGRDDRVVQGGRPNNCSPAPNLFLHQHDLVPRNVPPARPARISSRNGTDTSRPDTSPARRQSSRSTCFLARIPPFPWLGTNSFSQKDLASFNGKAFRSSFSHADLRLRHGTRRRDPNPGRS